MSLMSLDHVLPIRDLMIHSSFASRVSDEDFQDIVADLSMQKWGCVELVSSVTKVSDKAAK